MDTAQLRRNAAHMAKLAALSRAFYIGSAYIWHLLIPRFDKSTALVPSRSSLNFLMSWDAIYYFKIMKNGYTRVHETAFFPLLPYISRCISKITFLEPFTAGVAVSCTAFVLNAALLYKTTFVRYGSVVARTACLLFIFNPASIIYSSMYSESLFMLLFLLALHFIDHGNTVHGTIFLSLSGLCRSNAVLFALFVLAPLNKYTLVRVACVLFPCAAYQYYCLLLINHSKNSFGIFIPYSYVQKVYWEQGLFRFYKLAAGNIQNMLVGLPFILMALYIIYICWTRRGEKQTYLEQPNSNVLVLNSNICAAVLVVQTLITLLVIHWNMYFRFVSFNPVIYWTLAREYYRMESMLRKVLYRYFVAFGIVYAMLFGCFYPPC